MERAESDAAARVRVPYGRAKSYHNCSSLSQTGGPTQLFIAVVTRTHGRLHWWFLSSAPASGPSPTSPLSPLAAVPAAAPQARMRA